MSMDDDYEEDPMAQPITGAVAEPPSGKEPGFRLTIEASAWDETRISNAVLERVTANIAAKLEKAIDERLEAAVDAAVKATVEDSIVEQARQILAEGWTKTDEYGHARGPKVTFAERVHDILAARGNYEREGRLDKMIGELVAGAINKELRPEIDAAKLRVQELLNGTLSAKLLQAMKEGVGLK